MNRLQDKVVLVFGAGSSGDGWSNGKAAAVAYARQGARVVAIDRVEQAARETVECIELEHHQALAVQADVTESGSVIAAVEQAMQAFGRIDVLHNNVGTTVMGGPVELSEEAWNRSLDINLGSIYRTSKAVLPHMLKQGRGAIINISSLAAIRWTGYPYFAYYTAKAAVNQATGPIAFTINDNETASGSLAVSAVSSSTTFVPNANITFGGNGQNRRSCSRAEVLGTHLNNDRTIGLKRSLKRQREFIEEAVINETAHQCRGYPLGASLEPLTQLSFDRCGIHIQFPLIASTRFSSLR